MTPFETVHDLGIIVAAAAICLLMARAIRMPPIMAYILAGLLLGPVLGVSAETEAIERFSEIGIALLLFLVGLELSRDVVRGVGRPALLAGIGQVMLTAGAAFAIARVFGFDTVPAALLAIAVTFSSTVVVVKLLEFKGDLRSLYGRMALGILIVQDLLVVIVITGLAGLGAAAPAQVSGIGGAMMRAFGGMALLGGTAFLASRFLLRRPFGWLAGAPEALFIWSLSWCFLFIVAAEQLGLSVELGAFLAGVSLAQLPYNHELRRRVQPLVNLFIAIFFVTLGAHIELGAVSEYWPLASALCLLVLIGKPVFLMLLIPRLGQAPRTAFDTGIALGQISEFSFIVAGLGVAAGVLDETVFSLVGFVGIVTIGISSYLITYNEQLHAVVERVGLLRPFGPDAWVERVQEPPPQGHIIVVGMNSLGRRLVQALAARRERVVAIDTDPAKLEGLPAEPVLGSTDDEGVLAEANLAGAKLLISALQIQDSNMLLAYRCRQLGVPTSIHAFDPSVIDDLERIGVDHLMVSKHDGIRLVAAELHRTGVVR